MSYASDYQDRETARIERLGQILTVTRTNPAGTQQLYARAEPLNSSETGRLVAEGVLNSGEGNPHRFIFAGTADVQENVDAITFNGSSYRVQNVNPGAYEQGVIINLHAYAARE